MFIAQPYDGEVVMRYARLVRFTCNPGDEAPAKMIAEDLAPQIRHQPGCEQVVVFGDTNGDGGIFVLWDSQEHADAAAEIIRPKLQEHLAGHVTAPPDTRLFPVLSS
jgi:quinol monooxygenase YgiN